eukprot:3489232-Pyramimonas_sp.AAC.1
MRSLVLPSANDDDDKSFVLHNHDVPPLLLPMLTCALSQPGALSALSDRPHLLALLIESHRDTHFGVPHTDLLARSRRGTRPGSSCGRGV